MIQGMSAEKYGNKSHSCLLGVGNDDIMRLATDARFARTWRTSMLLSFQLSYPLFNPYKPIDIPYWVYLSNVNYSDFPLDSALLNTGKDVIVKDLGEEYTNIFDAQVDAAYSALEKADALNVEILNYMCSSVI
uniref:Uncharacterized protein n=1 Tax=Populus trichocarpa TaxID=3694 RepID=A0A2K2AG55_POPTR